MKILIYFLLLAASVTFLFISSCNKDKNEFGVEDTFNMDSLIVTPSSNIENEFTISWAVTTTGLPTFFLDVYLSNDNLLSDNDLKISSTSSADINEEVNVIDELQFYRIVAETGSNQVRFLHNEKSPDPVAEGWNETSAVNSPSGTSKFIIGYAFNIQGAQIKYERRLMAIPVTFQ